MELEGNDSQLASAGKVILLTLASIWIWFTWVSPAREILGTEPLLPERERGLVAISTMGWRGAPLVNVTFRGVAPHESDRGIMKVVFRSPLADAAPIPVSILLYDGAEVDTCNNPEVSVKYVEFNDLSAEHKYLLQSYLKNRPSLSAQPSRTPSTVSGSSGNRRYEILNFTPPKSNLPLPGKTIRDTRRSLATSCTTRASRWTVSSAESRFTSPQIAVAATTTAGRSDVDLRVDVELAAGTEMIPSLSSDPQSESGSAQLLTWAQTPTEWKYLDGRSYAQRDGVAVVLQSSRVGQSNQGKLLYGGVALGAVLAMLTSAAMIAFDLLWVKLRAATNSLGQGPSFERKDSAAGDLDAEQSGAGDQDL